MNRSEFIYGSGIPLPSVQGEWTIRGGDRHYCYPNGLKWNGKGDDAIRIEPLPNDRFPGYLCNISIYIAGARVDQGDYQFHNLEEAKFFSQVLFETRESDQAQAQ